jgi:hypothetical protein
MWGGGGEVGTDRQVRWRRVAVLVLAPSENWADGRRRGWDDVCVPSRSRLTHSLACRGSSPAAKQPHMPP